MTTETVIPIRADPSPVLVGRDEDLARFTRALVQAPSVVVVEGEAGVGKSRLVREALERIGSGGRVLLGACHPLPKPFPLGPVIEALQAPITSLPAEELANPLLGALRPLFPEAADRLPAAPEPLHDSDAERHRLFRAIAAAIDAVDPRVVVFEDLHWSDPATLELLTLLAAGLDGERSIIVTSRPEDVRPGHLLASAVRPRPGVTRTSLHLLPLDRAALRELTMSILSSEDISDEFTDYLYERTAGIPFALEELLRLLQERRDLVWSGHGWSRRSLGDLRVPSAIRDSILERVEGLSPDARRVVRAAAVLRIPADEHLIAKTAGIPAARSAAALSSAIHAALLQETADGRVSFRHGLASQAVYESLDGPEKRRLHLRAGRALEAVDPRQAASLAEHFREAGVKAKAVAYAETAADAASALFDDGTATRFLQQALDLLPRSSSRRTTLAAKLADAALHGLAHDAAIDVLRKMIEEQGLPVVARGELRFRLGRLLLQAGDAQGAVAEMRAAVPELRRNTALQARTMASLAYPWVREGHWSDHLAWLDRATAVAARIDDPDARMAILVDRATLLLATGDPAGWKAVLDIEPEGRSVESARQRARAAINLGEATFSLGHYDHSERFTAEGRDIAERHGYVRPMGLLEAADLRLDLARGRWVGLAERARALATDEQSMGGAVTVARLVLGLLAMAQGRIDEAEDDLRAALDQAEQNGGWFEMAEAAAGLARIRTAAGRPQEAVDLLSPTLAFLHEKGIWVMGAAAVPAAVQAWLDLGSPQEAQVLVGEMTRGLRGRDAPAARAGMAVARATLAEASGRPESASRTFAQAARAWRAIPHPYQAARALEGRGRCLVGIDEARGRALQLEALDQFETLGASWDVARVRRSLRRLGVGFGHRRGRKGYGDQLSPREAEIVALASEGRTNREIAEALFLSVRTIDAHMTRALRKLGVSSRRDLAALEKIR